LLARASRLLGKIGFRQSTHSACACNAFFRLSGGLGKYFGGTGKQRGALGRKVFPNTKELSMTTKTVALITGANKGLGLEIARQLGQRGLVVVLGARSQASGAEAAAKLCKDGIDAHAVQLDVTSKEDVARLPGFFQEKFGRLDVLVNNAGIAEWTADDELESFRRTFDTNFFGVVAVTYALLPLLRKSPAGRIVNQSSELGSLTSLQRSPEMFGAFVVPSYTCSKAALNGLTVSLAHKARGTPLKVNSAHPGWVKTDLGGDEAPMVVADGARTAVTLATLPPDGPTGQFFHLENSLPW
jgi:NAD(P)-dependent dehydrogenase (short-subunit alcohol dehydrogenase family)